MRYLISLSCVVIALMCTASSFAQEAEFKVVVHPSLQISEISKKHLKRIFLKQKSNWPTGQRAHPVDQKDEVVRAAFSEIVLRKKLSAVDSYWQGQVFAAKSTPPTVVQNDRAVLNYVSSNPGGVGYVSVSADTTGVKVVTVVD